MREKLEMLSALVDDELTATEQRQLLDDLVSNPALTGAWRRYNLIGEALREEFANTRVPDFAKRSLSRVPLDSSMPVIPPERTTRPRLMRTTGIALIATMAVAVIVAQFRYGSNPDELTSTRSPLITQDAHILAANTGFAERSRPDRTVVAARAQAIAENVRRNVGIALANNSITEVVARGDVSLTTIPITTVRYEESQPMRQDPRLDSYIVNFNEERVNFGVPGVHPYVRIVGYNAGN